MTFCHVLKLEASDGKKYKTDCANTEGMFRIIQSIPSPKAEPFKRWLARVGYERVKEIEDPELATKRTRALYKAKGYSDAWIEKRMRGIAIHDELYSNVIGLQFYDVPLHRILKRSSFAKPQRSQLRLRFVLIRTFQSRAQGNA